MFTATTAFAAVFHVVPVASPATTPFVGAAAGDADFFGQRRFRRSHGQLSVVSCQLSVVSGQLSVVSGQWAARSEKWSVRSEGSYSLLLSSKVRRWL